MLVGSRTETGFRVPRGIYFHSQPILKGFRLGLEGTKSTEQKSS